MSFYGVRCRLEVVVKKLLSLLVLAVPATIACATGSANDVTNDVSLVEADATPGVSLPPKSDASSVERDAADPTDGGGAGLDAADAADAADATKDSGPDTSTSGACGAGSAQLGEYATWGGKVNVHRATGGSWSVDTDCSSGANLNTVTYCQKFWPATTRQVQLASVSADAKPFTSGGGSSPTCGGVALSVGQNQFACCVP